MNLWKITISGTLMAITFNTFSLASVMAAGNITVNLDGNTLNFDVPPQIINESTMVPMRTIFEALGATVEWNQDTRTITSKKDETTVTLTIDSNVMYVNNNAVTLEAPACIIDDRTLVPIRAVAEAYGATVDWNGDTNVITITSAGNYNNDIVYYDDITANVNQINDYINNGMYLEAMQECENAKKYHNLSDADIEIVNNLYNTAQSKYNEYLQIERQNKLGTVVQSAVAAYIANLKVPSSAQIYSVYAGYYERSDYNEDASGVAIGIVIDGSGQNSFGGITRSETTILVDEATGQMIIDLEAYGKIMSDQSWGEGYIKGLNIQNEALMLQLKKTEIFQRFDV